MAARIADQARCWPQTDELNKISASDCISKVFGIFDM